MDWYLMVWRRYAEFDGRSRRKEYWMFLLFHFIAILVLAAIGGAGIAMSEVVGSSWFPVVLYSLAASFHLWQSPRADSRRRQERLVTPVVDCAWLIPIVGYRHRRDPASFSCVPGRRSGSEPIRTQSNVPRAGSRDVLRKQPH